MPDLPVESRSLGEAAGVTVISCRSHLLEDAVGPRLTVTDLRTGDELEVLNIGALSDRDRGEPVLGRLGSISGEPGLMFQSRPLSVDLSPDALEPPGRLLELRAAGLDDVTANGVMVVELALMAVRVSGAEAVGVIGPHLASVLVEPRVVTALRAHCVAPEHEHLWDVLAAGSIEPIRSRCTELARLCREAA